MYYDQNEVEKMLNTAKMHDKSIIQGLHSTTFRKILTENANNLVELQHILYQYPLVKYEPLDFMYYTIDSINALDEELAIDLATCTTTFGIVLLAWFNLVNPNDFQKNLLREVAHNVPHHHYAWFIQISINLPEEFLTDMQIIRQALQPFFNIRKRLAVAKDVKNALQLQSFIKTLYAQEGTDAVISYLKKI